MKRSKHNLSHYRLVTFNQGELVPVGVVEVLPGDSFRWSSSALIRCATLVAPLMHPVQVRIHHWFVPNRVVWADWDDFITGVNTSVTVPTVSATPVGADSILDYLGVPTGSNQTVNALPLRAYNMIYNKFYRDQDLITEVWENSQVVHRVSWEKDYFTSARTYPQFGSTTISIPFSSGSADVKTAAGASSDIGVYSTALSAYRDMYTGAAGQQLEVSTTTGNAATNKLFADLSTATGGIDVNQLRRSIALQKFLEARNRYGSRYRDYLRYLGIRPSDGRLEEPEYLGGGKQTIAFSEVLATADNGGTVEVGDMAGHGIAAMRTRPFTRFFEEAGYVLSLVSVRPKAIYMNSLHRHWLRSTKDDFWQKEYEAFGPQGVLTKEVYAAHPNATDVFGYVDRFREYREHPSTVHGDFRDTTSDYWHLARKLTASPSLNQTFIDCTPTDRVYADTTEPEIKAMISHRIGARRLVSKFARPM